MAIRAQLSQVSFANGNTLIFNVQRFFAKLVSFTKKGRCRAPRSSRCARDRSRRKRCLGPTKGRGTRPRGGLGPVSEDRARPTVAESADPTNQPTPRLGGSYGSDGGFWRRFFKLSRMSAYWRANALPVVRRGDDAMT